MNASKSLLALSFLLALGGEVRAQSSLPSNAQWSSMDDPDVRRATISIIENDLKRTEPSGTRLIACPMLIDYVEPMPTGHDSSFGAVCRLDTGGRVRSVTLCDDRLVGKFSESDQVADDLHQIAVFVATHCPPGG